MKLSEAQVVNLFEYRQESHFLTLQTLVVPDRFKTGLDAPGVIVISPGTALGRMDAWRKTVNIIDIKSAEMTLTNDPWRHAKTDLRGAQSFVIIPMMAGETKVGAFTMYRQTVRRTPANTTRLTQMFAQRHSVGSSGAWVLCRLAAPP